MLQGHAPHRFSIFGEVSSGPLGPPGADFVLFRGAVCQVTPKPDSGIHSVDFYASSIKQTGELGLAGPAKREN